MMVNLIGQYQLMPRKTARFIAAAIGLLVCGWLALDAARVGASRFLGDYGLRANLPIAVDRAVSLRASDPESRYTRAIFRSGTGEFGNAAQEFEQAVALRPRDYVLWMELGLARDQAGEVQGAIVAFREAARLAPYYAQPRWQAGNALLRANRYDEAFAELRQAIANDPILLPNAVDLAYGLFAGDADAVEKAIQPQTSPARLVLARFFAKHGKADESIRLFRATSQITAEERQGLLTELFNAKKFPEAYEVWSSGLKGDNRGGESEARTSIVDSSFEGQIRVGAPPGFGWRIERDQRTVAVSLNLRQPHSGVRSLLIEWNGDPQHSIPAISQLILVEPGKRYRLSLWARTEELVTAGSPIVTVSSFTADVERLNAQSAPMVQATNEWRQYSLEFETGVNTQAIIVAVRRETCASDPCPIFGRIWFDDFELSNS